MYLVTDGLASLSTTAEVVATHGAIILRPHRSSDLDPFRWVSTFIANFRSAICRTYHHFKFSKYLHRYLTGAQYRIIRRFDLRSLVGRSV